MNLCSDDQLRADFGSLNQVVAYDTLTQAMLVDVGRVDEVASCTDELIQELVR